MKVLMVGRSKSIAFKELQKYWGEVSFVKPPQLVKLKRYDLVIGQEPTLRIGVYAYLLSKITGSNLALEVHADYLESGLTALQKRIAEYLLRRCSLVRAVSWKIAEDVKKLGVKNVVMIPSIYVKTDTFRPLRSHSSRKPIILSVGRLVEQKNFPLLLYAFKKVKEQIPEAELVIHGRGPLEKEIVYLARKLGLENFKLITDWLPEEELAYLYNEAALLVITSRYEGGPRVAFEAGACHTPFVSTRVGILVEVAKHGVHGLFAERVEDFSEKIIMMIQDADLREKMGENFRRLIIEEFEWGKAIKRYAECYLNYLYERDVRFRS
jgi:glycosyltransferase involved in cell wall biosynthesis